MFAEKFTLLTINDVQKQVDSAPPFPKVMEAFQQFMVQHGLLDGKSGERLVRFCWCSDGPFDVRDFVVKQCFISKVSEFIALRIPAASFYFRVVRYQYLAGFEATSLMSKQ
jgi:inhibitor of KinA sporulation pathway (predicted exonuclease)